jgi:hypothetical protein
MRPNCGIGLFPLFHHLLHRSRSIESNNGDSKRKKEPKTGLNIMHTGTVVAVPCQERPAAHQDPNLKYISCFRSYQNGPKVRIVRGPAKQQRKRRARSRMHDRVLNSADNPKEHVDINACLSLLLFLGEL